MSRSDAGTRSVSIDIGINGAFITRRWEEPENWMRLTAETGYPCQEFCGDVLDPFFSGDLSYQMETARATKAAAARHGVTICDIYTGVATHRFHGLSHSDPRPRRRMVEWIDQCMDLALEMGTFRVGGHWDAFSVEVLASPDRTARAWDNLIETFRELARIGKSKGIQAIYQEQMYIPSEAPWTIEQAHRFLHEVNEGNPGCPVLLTVDVGHMAGQAYGGSGSDLDYLAWLREFGAYSEIIHLQQTTPDASHHWPFTEEYNRRGHISVPAVLDALRDAHTAAPHSPLARVLSPVRTQWLIAELIPGSTRTEEVVLREQTETAAFLRQHVPAGGIHWSFDA